VVEQDMFQKRVTIFSIQHIECCVTESTAKDATIVALAIRVRMDIPFFDDMAQIVNYFRHLKQIVKVIVFTPQQCKFYTYLVVRWFGGYRTTCSYF
jgi:hypothetical protein